MNNVLNCIRCIECAFWQTPTIPGILVNLIVTVKSKYTFLYRFDILWNFIGFIQYAYSDYSVFYLRVNIKYSTLKGYDE